MRKCLTKIFNIYFCDYTYNNLKYIINDPNTVLVSSEKRVCISIINHKDCFLRKMTDSGIENIVHIATEDGSLKDNKLFHSFLHRNFKNKKG